jgi:hypothetical protein
MPGKTQPLLDLGRRLLSLAAPPSITDLIAQLDEAEEYQQFIQIVRRFVPEAADDILARSSPEEKIGAFAQVFSGRYFQLDDRFIEGDVEGYSDIVHAIPVTVLGMSFDDYHELAHDSREGIQLMAYLLADPYEPVQQCHAAMPLGVEAGARLALYDSLKHFMPQELLDRVPQGGLPYDEAQRIFANSRYKAIALFSQMIGCCTGNFFLDTDYETLYMNESPDWDAENVEDLTRQWLQAEAIQEEVYSFCGWLKQDMVKHFSEVLYFLERGRYVVTTGPDANAVQLELALEP